MGDGGNLLLSLALPPPDVLPPLLALHPRDGPLLGVDALDLELEPPADRPVVRHAHLVPLVVELLDPAPPAAAPVEQPVAPRRAPLLLAAVVVVRAHVVLVRRREQDGQLLERAQAEGRVAAARDEQLVALEQLAEVARLDGGDDRVAAHGVDAVVEVAVEQAELVVEDHGAVAAAHEAVDARRRVALRRQQRRLQDGRDVVVPRVGRRLARRQVAVDEAERCVVHHEAHHDGALVAVQPAHAALDLGAAQVADALAEVRLDEDAREEADERCRVEDVVQPAAGHVVVEGLREEVAPVAVLVAHPFLVRTLLFLGFEKPFYIVC